MASLLTSAATRATRRTLLAAPSGCSFAPRRPVPELPDIVVYIEALESRVLGRALEKIRSADVFVLRTAVPPVDSLVGRKVGELRRLGKRIAFRFAGDLWLVVHLMVAGRLQWSGTAENPSARNALAHLAFPTGTLTLTEAGTKHRASLHLVEGEAALRAHDPGGIEVLPGGARQFAAALTAENHTLKRALTDPRLFSGIGNAYSDEILHAARLSPVALTQKLNAGEIARLHAAACEQLAVWTNRLRAEAAGRFPSGVTAFRPEMAVHGRFGKPCPACGAIVQRIRYADNEVNYCPRCQTGGRVLADRSLSRLLKEDWPRAIGDRNA